MNDEDSVRAPHQGQQSTRTAPTGRTHDCKRPLRCTPNDLLPGGGHPHMKRRAFIARAAAAKAAIEDVRCSRRRESLNSTTSLITWVAEEITSAYTKLRRRTQALLPRNTHHFNAPDPGPGSPRRSDENRHSGAGDWQSAADAWPSWKNQTAAIVEKAYDARRVAVASKAMIFGSGIFP